MRTPSCYSSQRKCMRPLDSEMRRSQFKDTAHVLFSPPSRSSAPSEGDVLGGGATLPTSGGTPMPHTGFTPGNFSPSSLLLNSVRGGRQSECFSALRPLSHSKLDHSMFSPVAPMADLKEVRRPILFSPGDATTGSCVVPSLSALLLDSAQKN
mmetsp:Transcript_33583/g.65531  ORF Transcript_33583/g.65531 Transcript_33583/m.65531 type:complete len:153 (+) Transcript_33583:3-461(+)